MIFGWWLKADKKPSESRRLKSRLSVSASCDEIRFWLRASTFVQSRPMCTGAEVSSHKGADLYKSYKLVVRFVWVPGNVQYSGNVRTMPAPATAAQQWVGQKALHTAKRRYCTVSNIGCAEKPNDRLFSVAFNFFHEHSVIIFTTKKLCLYWKEKPKERHARKETLEWVHLPWTKILKIYRKIENRLEM